MTIDPTPPGLFSRPISRRTVLRGAQGVAALGLAGGLSSFLAACGTGTTSAAAAASTSPGAPSSASVSPAAVAAGSPTASSGASGAVTPVSLQFCYLKNVQFAGSFFASTKGYYKSGGLDVTLLAGGPSLAPEPIVVAGKAMVGISHTAEVVSAIVNGADLKIIGAGFQTNPTCIASLATKPLKTPTDMYGKKIGISDSNAPIWQSFVKANKLDASKITVVTVGFDATSLVSGEIDGLMAFAPNEPSILKTKGVDTYVLLLSDFSYPLMEDLYIANASDVADPAKMKVLAALMKAEAQGWVDVVKDPAGAAELAVNTFGKDLKLDLAQQKFDAAAQNAFVADADTKANGMFWMTHKKIAGTIASLGLGGVTATASMFTNAVLTEAYKGGAVKA